MKHTLHPLLPLGAAGMLALGTGCWSTHRVKVETGPVEIKPIHITIDVNIRVERALDDFFGELDKAAGPAPAPAPAAPANPAPQTDAPAPTT